MSKTDERSAAQRLSGAIPLLAELRKLVDDRGISEHDRVEQSKHTLTELWVELVEVERMLTTDEEPDEGEET